MLDRILYWLSEALWKLLTNNPKQVRRALAEYERRRVHEQNLKDIARHSGIPYEEKR